MSILEKTIKTPHTIRWMWPIHIGLPKKISGLKEKLLSGYWSKVFVSLEPKPKSNHYNILLFDGSIDLEKYRPWGTSSADIILIFTEDENIDKLKERVENLRKHFEASGVFVFKATKIGDWFENFTEELSHNNNVVDALTKTSTLKFSLFDTKLMLQTTLSYVLEKMISTLKNKWYSNHAFNIQTRLTNKSNLTGKQIAQMLQSEIRSFDSETKSASDLNEISKQVFNNITVQYGKADIPTIKFIPGRSLLKPPINKGIQKAKQKGGGVGFKQRTFSAPVGNKPKMPKNGIGRVFIPKGAKSKKAAPKKAIRKKLIPKKTASVRAKKAAYPGRIGKKAIVRPITKGKKEVSTIKKVNVDKLDDSPRYLQANFKTLQEKEVKDYLKLNTKYNIEVRIGYKDEEFLDTGDEFIADTIFEKSKLAKETVVVKFKSNIENKVLVEKIKLPRQGNSDSAHFGITTDSAVRNFEGEISAYHKNRLLQKVKLIADIGKNNKKVKQLIEMQTVFSTRKSLDNVNKRTQFVASLEYKTVSNKSSQVSGLNENNAIDLFFENGLKGPLDEMKSAIENALIDVDNHPAKLSAKGNEELLLLLALQGNLIYTNCLRGAVAPDGPLQIITNYQEYAPLEFVYTLPAPDENATLCNNASAALKDGKCKNCFDRKESPAPHICPFGFWSFSRILERHSYKMKKNDRKSDYSIVSEPINARNKLNILQNSIYASSERVETSKTKGLRNQIGDSIKKQSKSFIKVDEWKKWTEEMQKNKPDSLFLVVHIEKNKFKIDQIEIGSDFLSQNYFGPKLIANKELIPPPFIIIIGCEATNLASSGFDVSAQLMNSGAAIVLSNFTKIRGKQAKDIILKLVEFLKDNGQKEASLGEVLLRLRQYLLSEGLIAGLSLIAQGDADWKIKT